jgi:hypothetical protein
MLRLQAQMQAERGDLAAATRTDGDASPVTVAARALVQR